LFLFLAVSQLFLSPAQAASQDLRAGLVPIAVEVDSSEKKDSIISDLAQGKFPAKDSLVKSPSKAPAPDSVRIGAFFQTGVAFIGFKDRSRFVRQLDSSRVDFLAQALTLEDSANVKAQAYQMVNFCFPVAAGLDLMLSQNHHIALGAGYIYDREAVVLTDLNSNPHEFFYTLQGFPLFLEWRIGISPRLMTLDGKSRFAASLRWWWLLSGSEIYSSWGVLEAKPNPLGSGWSVSLGYQILEWKNIRIQGDLGYSSISSSSRYPWSKVVPSTDPTENPNALANWSMGGLQLNLRATVGVLKR
jgi:hypothetical protein